MRFPCGHGNPEGNLFCDVCGARRAFRCPGCQAPNRSSAKFCGKCGFALAGAPAQGALPIDTTPEPPRSRARADDATFEWGAPGEGPADNYAMATEPAGASARLSGESETDSPARSRGGKRFGSERPDPPEDEDSLRLERFVSERIGARQRRGRARLLLGGIVAAAVLGFLIAAVIVGSGLSRGREGPTGAYRGDGQPPETATPPDSAPASPSTTRPSGTAASPSPPETAPPPPASSAAPPPSETATAPPATDQGTASSPSAALPERPAPPALPPRPDQSAARGRGVESRATAPRPESPGSSAQRSESPATDASRSESPAAGARRSESPATGTQRPETPARAADRSGQRPEAISPPDASEGRTDSAGIMAESLVAKHGPEQAEKTALANASWYQPGTSTHAYWQRVANLIRKSLAR
jgi:Double zinc ribbon